MRRTITKEQYNDLVVLLSAAQEYRKKMDALIDLALFITDERDKDGEFETTGHTADAVTCGYSVEMLLGLLEIGVDGHETNDVSYYSDAFTISHFLKKCGIRFVLCGKSWNGNEGRTWL